MSSQLEFFLMTVSMYLSSQLGFTIDWHSLSLKKVPWDAERFVLAVEVSDTDVPPLRVRMYFRTYGNVLTIGTLKITEDPNYAPSPDDELYVTEGIIDRPSYQALIGYFQEEIEPSEYLYYDVILDDDFNVILANDGNAILYH